MAFNEKQLKGGAPDPHLGQVIDFEVVLMNVRGRKTEHLTDNIKSLEIEENIYNPFLSATMVLMDDSGLFNTMPLVGQEEVMITWNKDGAEMYLAMLVTDIGDVVKIKSDVAQFSVTLTEMLEFRNSSKTFSKSYSGPVVDIITEILDDNFDFMIDPSAELMNGSPTVSVVFPFMRPYQAVQMLLNTVPSNDGSPIFMTTSVWGPHRRLLTMRDMRHNPFHLEFEKAVLMHQDPMHGSTMKGKKEYRNTIFDLKIEDAYDTMRLMGAGAYAANATKVDISTKSVNTNNFNYLEHQELHDYKINNPLQKTYTGNPIMLPPGYSSQKEANMGDLEFLHERYKSKHYSLPQNSMGFSSSHQNVFTQDPIEIMGHSAFREKFTTSQVTINCDPVPWLKCGQSIKLLYRTNTPKYDENTKLHDQVNSGDYVIESITHMFKTLEDGKLEYKYSMDLIRDRIGIAHKE
jgi:hypothetical protein